MPAPSVTIIRKKGQPAVDPGTDFRMCIVGTSSASPVAAGALSSLYYQPGAIAADFGIGDGVDACTQALTATDDNPQPPGLAFLSTLAVGGLTPGVRGATLTQTSTAGSTATVTKTTGTHPAGTYEPRVRVADDGNSGAGGTIGVAGIVLEASVNNGRNWLPTKALGAATSFTIKIPNPGGSDYDTGITYDLGPSGASKAALYTKVTLLQTTLTGTGHFVDIAASVHLVADTIDDVALAAIPAATTDLTAVTLFNACLSYLGIHGANLTYHTIADAPLATALAAIPVAVTIGDVDLHLPALIAAYNAHRVNVTGVVHGAADNANTITAYVAVPGTLFTGDGWTETKTLPPQWAIGDLYTAGSPGSGALMAIAQSATNFGLIAITEPVVAANIAVLSAALDAMKAIKSSCRPTLLVRFRDQAVAESDATYIAATTTFLAACARDARISGWANDGWLTDAFRGYVYSRNMLPSLLARLQGMSIIAGVKGEKVAQSPGWAGRGPLPDFTVRDAAGNPVGHDERIRGGILGPVGGKGGFGCCYYESHEAVPGTYIAGAPVLYDVLPTIVTVMDNRVSSGIERLLYGIAFTFLQGADVVTGGILDDDTRDAMAQAGCKAIKDNYQNEIANPNDPNLVTVDANVTVSGADITVFWYVNDRLFNYNNAIVVTVANARS